MAARVTLQSLEMRGRGIGWKADRCADPEICDVHLCVVDAELDAMPGHVVVKVGRGWDALRRGAVVGAVGLGGTAAVLGMWWGRQRIFSMKTLSASGAYGAKASRSA
jgi:hypothetical protein